MNRQRQEVEEKVFTEVISSGAVVAPKRGRKGRKSVGCKGVANQEIVNTLRAIDIFTDNITFTNANGTISINVGPIGTSNINQGTYSIAIGSNAGLSNQGSYAVAIGTNTGMFSQGEKSFAIGTDAGQCNQGIECINIGYQAGRVNTIVPPIQKSISIGDQAGESNQNNFSIAIGDTAGQINQGSQSIAIGKVAGNFLQSSQSVALGSSCGANFQGYRSIAVGNFSGHLNQKSNCVALGPYAADENQQPFQVTIGAFAGRNAGTGSIAIGGLASPSGQGMNAIAIGFNAARSNQSSGSIALGFGQSISFQGQKCVRIGAVIGATFQYQTSNCVAIGSNSGFYTQLQNTICLGAKLQTLTQNSCYIKNIRKVFGAPSPGVLSYNTTTGEVFQDTGKTFVIDHPSKNDKNLVYACVESNEVGVFYKGKGEIVSNKMYDKTEIFIPEYIKPICRDFMIFITPCHSNSKLIASRCINNEKFKIIGNPCKFDYIIYAKRLSNFESVLQKDSCKIMGGGPYTFYNAL